MALSGRQRRLLGPAVVLAVGVGTFGLQLVHAMEQDETVPTLLFGILAPMAFSLGIVAGALWLARSELSADHRWRVAGWCVVGGAFLSVAGLLIILYQRYEGVVLTDQPYMVGNTAVIGATAGFVVGVYDAQRLSLAETFDEERVRAERLNQRLTVVNRVLRHDVRNGVNVIYGYADKLVTQFDDEDARRIRDRIMELYELTETARAVERSLGDRPGETTVDLVPILRSIVAEVRAEYPGVDVETDLPDAQWVYANSLLESAVENVVENAIEHNDAEDPRVSVSVRTDDHDREPTVAIRIADNGPGISADQRVVFERGWESPLEHSMGTGLWLSNWIVEDVGGVLSIEGNDGGPTGTAVVIRLRRAAEPATVDG